MNDIIFQLAMLLVSVSAAAVARYVVPWIQSNINAHILAEVQYWVEAAVFCAQQMFEPSDGQKKKEAVELFLKDILQQKGIPITDSQLDTLIEAAVKQLKLQEG